jgi:PAS domain S-box-containing protein
MKPMPHSLQVLIVADPPGADRLLRELRRAGFEPVITRVDSESDYMARLASTFDVILADDDLASLRASRALQLMQARSIDIPFIIVADRMEGEDAVERIKQGAMDYVRKDRIERLGHAVQRALQEHVKYSRSQDALTASQGFARNIIDSSLDMIIAVDQDRRIVEFNRAAEETFGYRRDEVLHQSVDILYADPPVGATIHERTVSQGRSVQQVYNRRKNGEVFPSYLAASVLTDAHGKPIGLMGISRDISELRRAEQELERRADEFSALYETTRDLATQYHLPTLLKTIVERATKLLKAPGGGIYLFDRERSDLHFEAAKGAYNPVTGTRITLGEGMAGRVAQTRQPMIVDDYRSSECRSPRYEGMPIAAVVEVPMLYGGELVGVLVVDETETATRKFTEADTRLLDLFATHAASAVHNATLFEQVRTSRERLQMLSNSLIRAQEMERRNIARELHDEIGQVLTGVQLNAQAIESFLSDDSARARLHENMVAIENVMHQVRDLSLALRPSVLDDFGLTAALKWLVSRQPHVAGQEIQFTADHVEPRLNADIETVCFRIAQEALTNAIKHANASRVSIELKKRAKELELLIHDDGVGFDVERAVEHATAGASLGLLGMYERVVLIGGRIDIESTLGQGTRVRARFPVSTRGTFVERRRRRRKSQ